MAQVEKWTGRSSKGSSVPANLREIYRVRGIERSLKIDFIHNSPRSCPNDDLGHASDTIEVTLLRKGRLYTHHKTRVLRVPELFDKELLFTNKARMNEWEYSKVSPFDMDPTGRGPGNLIPQQQDPGWLIHKSREYTDHLEVVTGAKMSGRWEVRVRPANERAALYKAQSEAERKVSEAQKREWAKPQEAAKRNHSSKAGSMARDRRASYASGTSRRSTASKLLKNPSLRSSFAGVAP